MNALKKLLTGLLIFSILSGASLALNKEKFVYREALGLYTTGQFQLAKNILEKLSQKEIKLPKTMVLLGFSQEASGEFAKAERSLNNAWTRALGNLFLQSLVEDAAIRLYALENPIGASVVLELGLKKAKKNQKCIILFNQILAKEKLGLEASLEKELLQQECQGIWFQPLIQSILQPPSQTPRPTPPSP